MPSPLSPRAAKAQWLEEFGPLDEIFALFRPAPRLALWSDQARSMLIRALEPAGDGAMGKIQASLACACAGAFLLRERGVQKEPFTPNDAGLIMAALRRAASEHPAMFSKAFNKAVGAVAENFGWLALHQASPAALPTMLGVFAAAPLDRLRQAAARILPPWQLKAESSKIKNVQACLTIYQELFRLGVRLEDIFPCSPTAGKSMSQTLLGKIQACGGGDLRQFLLAQWESQSLSAPGVDSAWDAKALCGDDQNRMLALIERLDHAFPGEGAARAIEWLGSHPALDQPQEPGRPKGVKRTPKAL